MQPSSLKGPCWSAGSKGGLMRWWHQNIFLQFFKMLFTEFLEMPIGLRWRTLPAEVVCSIDKLAVRSLLRRCWWLFYHNNIININLNGKCIKFRSHASQCQCPHKTGIRRFEPFKSERAVVVKVRKNLPREPYKPLSFLYTGCFF